MMMQRRKLLVAGGALLGLPWLQHLDRPAHAQSAPKPSVMTPDGFPKRVLIFFKPGGMWEPKWFPIPGETESSFQLNEHTQPLAPMRDKLLFVDGIDNKWLSGTFSGRVAQQNAA